MQGKVRDVYELEDRLVIVTTDRQSAFDRLLAAVPYKVNGRHHVTPTALVCSGVFVRQLLSPWQCASMLVLLVFLEVNKGICASVQGQVLNQTSAWWMEATQHIVPNALLAVPDPNVSVMQKCSVFPVEFVVRDFMTGVWTPCRLFLQRHI